MSGKAFAYEGYKLLWPTTPLASLRHFVNEHLTVVRARIPNLLLSVYLLIKWKLFGYDVQLVPNFRRTVSQSEDHWTSDF